MKLKSLASRVTLAVAVPVVLVTATLRPIATAYIDARQEVERAGADSMLEAGHETLRQAINESLSHVLVSAEKPAVERFLSSRLAPPDVPAREAHVALSREQLESLFDAFLEHYGRYAQVALIDTQGEELVVATDPAFAFDPVMHAERGYFLEAMSLGRRDMFISSPYLPASARGGDAGPVVDVATPVFGPDGERQAVLLFRLDWARLIAPVRHVLSLEEGIKPFMMDARGTWLLASREEGSLEFGAFFPEIAPELWNAITWRNTGEIEVDDRLVSFATHDIRTQPYRGRAGMITSPSGEHPWRLGVVLEKPTLTSVLVGDIPVAMVALMIYGLSIAFGVYWAFSHHRQLVLRRHSRRLAKEAQANAREVADLYEHAPCGYHSLDADGRVVKMNRTELSWLGYSADEVVGVREYRDFVTPETREDFEAAFAAVLGPEGEGSAEVELVTREGKTLPVVIQASAYTTTQGFVHSRAMVFDLTDRKEMEEVLARQALTDPLTGLGNRRYLEDQAHMEMARARRRDEPLSLIAIDLDHFKHINDTYGHDVGDRVLESFADTAQRQLRDGDVLARMGGEEFAVLLPGATQEQALQVAGRLRMSIAQTPLYADTFEGGRLFYTASMGVTAVVEERSLKPAIKRADKGLYEAKAQGRNRVVWRPVEEMGA